MHTEGRKRSKRKWLFGGFGVFLLLAATAGGARLASGQVPDWAHRLVAPAGSAIALSRLPGCAAAGALPGPDRVLHARDGRRPGRPPGLLRAAAQLGGLRGRHAAVRCGAPRPGGGHRGPDRAQGVQHGDLPQPTARTDSTEWALSVLPPTASDRTFRCLAGQGAGKLRGTVLAPLTYSGSSTARSSPVSTSAPGCTGSDATTPADGRVHRVLQLHRLQGEQQLTGADPLAGHHQDPADGAGQRRDQRALGGLRGGQREAGQLAQGDRALGAVHVGDLADPVHA